MESKRFSDICLFWRFVWTRAHGELKLTDVLRWSKKHIKCENSRGFERYSHLVWGELRFNHFYHVVVGTNRNVNEATLLGFSWDNTGTSVEFCSSEYLIKYYTEMGHQRHEVTSVLMFV